MSIRELTEKFLNFWDKTYVTILNSNASWLRLNKVNKYTVYRLFKDKHERICRRCCRYVDSVLLAIRLPEQRIKQELLHELVIALYAQDLLSFGKAVARDRQQI